VNTRVTRSCAAVQHSKVLCSLYAAGAVAALRYVFHVLQVDQLRNQSSSSSAHM
jgi:hypothetical protein